MVEAGGELGRRRDRIGDRRAILPAGEGLLQLGEHLTLVEVARHRHDHVARMEDPRVHLAETVRRQRGDTRGRGLTRLEVVVAPQQSLPLPREDRRGIVVALFEGLHHPSLRGLQSPRIEPRLPQHVDEQPQALIEIARQTVQPGRREGIVAPHAHLGGEEVELLVKLRRLRRLRSSLTHHPRGRGNEPRNIGRIERRSPLERDRDLDEGKLVGWRHIDHRAIGQRPTKLLRFRNLEIERLKLDFLWARRKHRRLLAARREPRGHDSQDPHESTKAVERRHGKHLGKEE